MFWNKKNKHIKKANKMKKAGWDIKREPSFDTEEGLGYVLEKGKFISMNGPKTEIEVILVTTPEGEILSLTGTRTEETQRIDQFGFPLVSYPKKTLAPIHLFDLVKKWESVK